MIVYKGYMITRMENPIPSKGLVWEFYDADRDMMIGVRSVDTAYFEIDEIMRSEK